MGRFSKFKYENLILFSRTSLMADLMLFSPNLQTLVLVVDFLKSFRASTLGGNIQDEIAIFTRKRSSAPACSSKQLNRDVHFLKMCGHGNGFVSFFS